MKTLTRFAAVATLAASAALPASAALLATYDLDAAAASTLPVASSAPGFAFSAASGVGATGGGFSNHFYFTNWDGAVNAAKYVSLTVSNAAAYTLSTMTFSVEYAQSGFAGTVYARSSLDGFASDVDSFAWANPASDVTDGDFDLSGLGVLNGLTELRFYFAAASTGHSVGFANHQPPGAGGGFPDVGRDIQINGNLAVPEPGSLALIGIGLAVACAVRRRKAA